MSDQKVWKKPVDLWQRLKTEVVGQYFSRWLCFYSHLLPAGNGVFAADSAWEERWGNFARLDVAKTSVAFGVGHGACGDVFFGTRRMFSANFKLRVLDSYRQDPDCKGNQRATARKYGIHRRQIQKWLQVESCLRSAVEGQGDMALDLVVRGKETAATSIKYEPLEEEDDEEEEEGSPPPESPTTVNQDSSIWMKQEVQEDVATALPTRLPTFSKRRSFSLQFKLGVLDAFHAGCGNQRATARLFGINRRQVQKWLRQEARLRSEASVAAVAVERQRLGRWAAEEEDTGYKAPAVGWEPPLNIPVVRRPWADDDEEMPELKVPRWEFPMEQETALCLVKEEKQNDESDAAPIAPKERRLPPAPHRGPPPPPAVYATYDEFLGMYQNAMAFRWRPNGIDMVSSSSSADSSPDPAPFSCLSPSPPGGRRRQCYHLDFKLWAIKEYREGDGEWRGNQRAVAKRFGVHRRQIQKWLKQEEQLRQRAAGATSGIKQEEQLIQRAADATSGIKQEEQLIQWAAGATSGIMQEEQLRQRAADATSGIEQEEQLRQRAADATSDIEQEEQLRQRAASATSDIKQEEQLIQWAAGATSGIMQEEQLRQRAAGATSGAGC